MANSSLVRVPADLDIFLDIRDILYAKTGAYQDWSRNWGYKRHFC